MADAAFKSVRIYNENDKLITSLDAETIVRGRSPQSKPENERLTVMCAAHEYGQELLREGKVKGYYIQMEKQNGETFYCPVL